MEAVKTVEDLEKILGNGYKLSLGFERLPGEAILKNIQTDSKRRINIIDTSRLDKLEEKGYISANYVYSVENDQAIHNEAKANRLKIYGVKLDDLTEQNVEEEEFDEFTAIEVFCDSVFINERYPDYSNFFTIDGVRIHSNKYNISNGILGKLAGFDLKYIFIADMIIVFDFPEPIEAFYSFEMEFFPDFFVRSKNYVYFINRDKLMRYSQFIPIEFETKYFAKNYKPSEFIKRKVVSDIMNVFRFEGVTTDSDDIAGAFVIDERIIEKSKLQEKLEVYQEATVDNEAEFDYDEHFEVYYY